MIRLRNNRHHCNQNGLDISPILTQYRPPTLHLARPWNRFYSSSIHFFYCDSDDENTFFCKGRRTCLSESKYSDNQHIVCKIKSFSWKNPVFSCLEEKQFFNPIICGNWRNQFCMKQLNCCDIRTFFLVYETAIAILSNYISVLLGFEKQDNR